MRRFSSPLDLAAAVVPARKEQKPPGLRHARWREEFLDKLLVNCTLHIGEGDFLTRGLPVRREKELPDLHAVLNELDDTARGVVDGVAPTDIQLLF